MDNFLDWETPTWHPDFGDPAIEVEILRVFCQKLKVKIPSIEVSLICPEEGYLNVDILLHSRKLAEIHVVDSENGGKRLGFFECQNLLEEDEKYFQDHEEGIRFVSELVGNK